MLNPQAKARFVNRQLQREEGFNQYPYDDETGERVHAPKGNITIGIGFNLDAGCPLDLAVMIANYFVDKNDAQLSKDLKDLNFYDDLDDVRKCVLLDLAFNMGVRGLEAFTTTINLISKKFYTNAAAQLRKTALYGEEPHRLEPLCVELETGEWMPGV